MKILPSGYSKLIGMLLSSSAGHFLQPFLGPQFCDLLTALLKELFLLISSPNQPCRKRIQIKMQTFPHIVMVQGNNNINYIMQK